LTKIRTKIRSLANLTNIGKVASVVKLDGLVKLVIILPCWMLANR
jgi:hypothetical protein